LSIQYSGTVINDSFTGQSVQSILDGIRTALLAAGWTLYNRHRAGATFLNYPFNGIPANGEWVEIGQTVYKFYTSTPFTDGSFPVFAGSGASAQTCFSNLGSAIQNNDPIFNCIQAGTFDLPQAWNGVQIVAGSSTTAYNNITLGVDSANLGSWFVTPAASTGVGITTEGGWELESQQTGEGLKLRVRLVGEFNPSAGLQANLYVTTVLEDTTSAVYSITVNPVLTYRIICGPYQLFIFASESTTNGTAVSGGVPYLQSFLVPNPITAATSATPVQCTTLNAHGLSTGQTISITEALEKMTIGSMGRQPSGLQTGNILVSGNNTFRTGDTVRISTGDAVVDGIYTISNVSSTSFSLDNSTPNIGTATGFCYGPKHSVNGTWTVTVIDNFNFTLNGSVGAGSQPYYGVGLVAAPGTLNRAIWSVGSSGANFRTGLYSAGNAQFMALNSASYEALTNIDQANPRLVMPGLPGKPLNFSNGCAAVIEPLIAAGANGAGSPPMVFGQLWDSALVTTIYTLDIETSFDNHNYHLYSSQVGDSTHFQGGFFLAIS